MLQRPGGETGSFGSIAGAETALTREFGRHVFEIAALLRVSQRLYNYRVWVVGATGIEPVTPTMSRCGSFHASEASANKPLAVRGDTQLRRIARFRSQQLLVSFRFLPRETPVKLHHCKKRSKGGTGNCSPFRWRSECGLRLIESEACCYGIQRARRIPLTNVRPRRRSAELAWQLSERKSRLKNRLNFGLSNGVDPV